LAEVRFQQVSKAYPPHRGSEPVEVLRQLDLDIEDGEFLVLVGPSGCGKSTLLRLLAGLEQPTGGEIYVGSRPVSQLRPAQRDVAMVFQSYALYYQEPQPQHQYHPSRNHYYTTQPKSYNTMKPPLHYQPLPE